MTPADPLGEVGAALPSAPRDAKEMAVLRGQVQEELRRLRAQRSRDGVPGPAREPADITTPGSGIVAPEKPGWMSLDAEVPPAREPPGPSAPARGAGANSVLAATLLGMPVATERPVAIATLVVQARGGVPQTLDDFEPTTVNPSAAAEAQAMAEAEGFEGQLPWYDQAPADADMMEDLPARSRGARAALGLGIGVILAVCAFGALRSGLIGPRVGLRPAATETALAPTPTQPAPPPAPEPARPERQEPPAAAIGEPKPHLEEASTRAPRSSPPAIARASSAPRPIPPASRASATGSGAHPSPPAVAAGPVESRHRPALAVAAPNRRPAGSPGTAKPPAPMSAEARSAVAPGAATTAPAASSPPEPAPTRSTADRSRGKAGYDPDSTLPLNVE